MAYAQKYKRAMVKKMLSPGGPSAGVLSKKYGISPATLSRWKTAAGIVDEMSKNKIKPTEGCPDDRAPEEKFQLILESSQLKDDQLGEFLRRHGLHQAQLERWKAEALEGFSTSSVSKPKKCKDSNEAKEIRELKNQLRRKTRDYEDKLKRREKEIKRKDKALAEAAALVILKKKAEALWGDGDDDME